MFIYPSSLLIRSGLALPDLFFLPLLHEGEKKEPSSESWAEQICG
jgi:hypothetical protein|tara:strand:+ start:13116 stop:13250 length:135 start_codon:yes stop_codon:yes gene_type:complete